MSSVSASELKGNVIQIDEDQIRGHVDAVVRDSVEETLNQLLDAEADQLVGAIAHLADFHPNSYLF